jgi:hypothetical protein
MLKVIGIPEQRYNFVRLNAEHFCMITYLVNNIKDFRIRLISLLI